jgi:hypothetical protein
MSRPRLAVAVAVAIGLLLCASSGLGGHDLLCLAPALLLLAILFARRYPGERLLLGLADRRRHRRPRAAGPATAPFARSADMPRGGLLMGFALAVRPPPRLPAAS